MSEKRVILLVDDSEDDIMLTREGFTQAGCHHELREVHNGEEAIEYLTGEGLYSDRGKFPLPAVMLLDINMPKRNGYDVLAWVRAQPGLRYLTVFILTASMRSEDKERAYRLGATGFLVKPSTLDALTVIMRCVCDWVDVNQFPSLNYFQKD